MEETATKKPQNVTTVISPAVACGEIGIRTLEALSALTHFPGVRLRPLGHLSLEIGRQKYKKMRQAAHFRNIFLLFQFFRKILT